MTAPEEPKKAPAKKTATAAQRAARDKRLADEAAAREEKPQEGPAAEPGPTEQEWREALEQPYRLMALPEEMTVDQFLPTVHESWCRVMESVKSVTKGDYNKDQHFRFRGIDAVMDAVGPALRMHHVHVRPRRILEHSATEYTSKSGGRMVNRIVRVEWEVTGPQGDSFVGESMGEAADSSDKSLTKAQSVAYRVFLLNALTVPTDSDDPDAETHERATPSERQQAVRQASEKTYTSREEFERERQAQAQQSARQEQAGEDNQAAQSDIAEARKVMWSTLRSLGWEWKPLAARFKADHDGRTTDQATKEQLEKFTDDLVREAQEEEDRAKQVAGDVLGAKEIQPDEAQNGPLL